MSVAGWIADRVGWNRIETWLGARTVSRRGWVFHVGGITLFLLVVQVASGILLTLYYRPDAEHAHASVERIVGEISYGDLVRGVHVWAADLFVASLFVHLVSVLVRRSFRPPHELGWVSGVALLFVGVAQAFTGAVLPWSQKAYTDARVGSEFARYVPFVGPWLHRFMRGGEDVDSATLTHAFGFHAAVLPAAMTVLVGVHVFLVSRRPLALPDGGAPPSVPLYPDFVVRLGVAVTGTMVLLLSLATFWARSTGVPADPRLPSSDAVPPWYLLPAHAILRAAPKELLGFDGPSFLIGAASALGVVLVALPFIDRRGSRITAWVACAALLTLILLSFRALP
jgi:quinol-cytochrome oxidoreductase complex cytochrome b subunit